MIQTVLYPKAPAKSRLMRGPEVGTEGISYQEQILPGTNPTRDKSYQGWYRREPEAGDVGLLRQRYANALKNAYGKGSTG